MFVRRRVGVGGRDRGVGGIYGGALVELALIFVVGVGLGISRACVEAHAHVGTEA